MFVFLNETVTTTFKKKKGSQVTKINKNGKSNNSQNEMISSGQASL